MGLNSGMCGQYLTLGATHQDPARDGRKNPCDRFRRKGGGPSRQESSDDHGLSIGEEFGHPRGEPAAGKARHETGKGHVDEAAGGLGQAEAAR